MNSSKPPLRSQSVGSIPREKRHPTSRVESSSGATLDVRCACQYYQCDSLLPERVNPLGSRPESNIGFVSDIQQPVGYGSHTGHEFFAGRSGRRIGMQFDQMSIRSCTVGHGLHPNVEKQTAISPIRSSSRELGKSEHDLPTLGIKNALAIAAASAVAVTPAVAETPGSTATPTVATTPAPVPVPAKPAGKGLVVRSISDASDLGMMPPPWKQRALSIDRLSQRSFGMRDPDTISMRSMGLRRISRSTSKTDLFVADTNIPGSRRGSKIEIPQINFIAPTPTREMKAPFSVYEEFRKSNSVSEEEQMQTEIEIENKENVPHSTSDICAPVDKHFKDSFPPDPGQGSSGLSSQSTTFSSQPLMEANQNTNAGGNYYQEQQKSTPGGYYQEQQRSTSGGYHQEQQRSTSGGYRQEQQRSTSDGYHQEQQRSISGGYHQEQQRSTPSDMTKLKRQHAADAERYPIDTVQIVPQITFDMRIEEIPPSEYEEYPKQESKSFIKSLFKSSKSSEPSNTSEASSTKESSFSFKTLFKSKPTESVVEPTISENYPKEEPINLVSILKPSKPMEISEEMRIDELTLKPVPINQMELVVVGEEEKMPERTKPLVIETAIKQVAPSEAMETFSLKVDDLDQYSIKPKVEEPLPIKMPQKLKISSIDLTSSSPPPDEMRFRQRTPTPLPAQYPIPIVEPTFGKPRLFKRSDILRSSQPELSMPGRIESTNMRDRSSTPLHQHQNLISVPIDIPEPPTTEEEMNEEYAEDSSKISIPSSASTTGKVAPQVIGKPQVIAEPQVKPSEQLVQHKPSKPEIRSTSRERMMQSKLLRKKDYFNRTQSQDRTPMPPSQRGSMVDIRIRSGSLTKTVSFDFGGHQSRLTDHESVTTTNRKRDNGDWIERTYFMRDHEYEPIGEPVDIQSQQTKQPQQQQQPPFEKEPSPNIIPSVQVSEPMEVDQIKEQKITISEEPAKELQTFVMQSEETSGEEQQREIEERYFSSATTTPRTESRTDYEIHTSQVDSSALEELPLKPENRKKGFMANAQDKSRKMQANLRSQAGKIRTKLRGTKKPPPPSGSPKAAKDRKRFKAPEFTKMKLPEIKRPEIPKFKTPEFKKIEFKRPEFTKFNKPDMSKFKIPERFSSLKLTRSKSLKESTEPPTTIETQSGTTPESTLAVTAPATSSKKKFDFTFGTYPLRKKKDKIANQVVARADDVPTSSETPPSLESGTIPRGARDKGPVGSRWADKFSDVSYGDSESGKYQRYGSEVESSMERGDRESSLERRMKEDLEQRAQEEAELAALETVEQKQFAEYDEENRAIHEISKSREGEFKKRHPMVHQISDVSVESKEVGWTERDILRNKILRGTESEADAAGNYPSEEGLTGSLTNQSNQETQSTGSSGALRQKGVLEEIDDDQFFLRKRGISQDNIEIRQYISTAIREGFDTPLNALAQLGDSQGIYPTSDIDSSGQINYGYDVPPPKPRRVKKYKYDENLDSAEISQEFDIEQKENYDDNISLPQTGSDYFKNLPPSRPLRKPKKQYSEDSQGVPENDIPYFDEEDDRLFYKKEENNNLDIPQITKTFHPNPPESYINEIQTDAPPKAPKRRKKQLRESIEKDSIVNGFGGRSISNTFLPEEELIVYRTQHEYIIPLAQTETFTTPTPPSRSRSRSRITDDDRTSRGADSTVLDVQQDDRFFVEMRENDGYAVVRKEPPPRPPPPVRRKRSPNLLDDKFATMPHFKTEVAPERPKRNYSTIGPSRPPRRKSSASIGETSMRRRSSDITQYEELDDDERPESPRNLISGDVINKMKYRPLPPPPRPPRDNRRNKNGGAGDKFDKDGGAERIVFDMQQNGNYDIDKTVEKCIEVEVSTQTDPLPDDFVCEEFEITDDMKIIEPRRSKTLEDILKEEQEAEIERARQLAEEENLTKSIQKFREAGQRSYSERSRGSTGEAERSRTHSRPSTPAIVIEKRVPTPIPNKINETMLAASLIVQPVDNYDIDEELSREMVRSEEQLEEQVAMSDISSQKQEEEERLTVDYSSDQRSVISDAKTLDRETEKPSSYEGSLREEKTTTEDERYSLEDGDKNIASEFEEPPPQPPPRKRSSVPTVDTIDSSSAALSTRDQQLESERALTVHSEQTVESSPSTKLAIADLEVERLSVHALQAGRIMVSELQGSQISADELECKSGNLVVQNLQFPPGFIEQIIERVRSTEREQHSQAQTQTTEEKDENVAPTTQQQDEVPARPPLPQQPPVFTSEDMQYSIPPPSFYQLRSPTEEEHPQHFPVQRRRRHHRRRDSSSADDEYSRERRRSSRHDTRSPEPSIGQLSGQLLRLCGSNVMRTMNQIVNYLQTAQKEGTERNISTAMVLLVLMAFGFLMLGLSGKNIHHHHWDFFNPPGNEGRDQ